jgi:hypothetical protein
MKRCSQCDFIFEDDQELCDFDGTELTTFPEPTPFAQNISPKIQASKTVTPSPFRRLALSRASLTALLLAGLISLRFRESIKYRDRSECRES